MKTIAVNLPHHSYEILIGNGILADAATHIRPFLRRDKVAIVTDSNVEVAVLPTLLASLDAAGVEHSLITVPAGEASKSWAQLEHVTEGLLAAQVERDDIVIALGGGVVGDLVGFAAAILRRGVRFVQIPTSLLAQVDSSVGGKTGINSPLGKNLIGAFHQPDLVLADIGVLKTLPAREFLSGYGEVVKYGLLGDAEFFEWLENNAQSILALDDDITATMVAHCCQMKADIVERDEFEKGDRALLNLGHTFGHALEAVTGYSSTLLHGEGVAIGCGLAFDLSSSMGVTKGNFGGRIRVHLAEMGMKAKISDIDFEMPDASVLLQKMYQDKKVQGGALTFILADQIGHAIVQRDVDPEAVFKLLTFELTQVTSGQ